MGHLVGYLMLLYLALAVWCLVKTAVIVFGGAFFFMVWVDPFIALALGSVLLVFFAAPMLSS